MEKTKPNIIFLTALIAVSIAIGWSLHFLNIRLAEATVSGTNINRNISTETLTTNTVTSTNMVADQLGVGTSSPLADIEVVGGTLTADTSDYFLKLSGTLPSNASSISPTGVLMNITSGGGSTFSQNGVYIEYADGGRGTTSQWSRALTITNTVISSNAFSMDSNSGTTGIYTEASGASLDNIGLYSQAYGATGKNIGGFFRSNHSTPAAVHASVVAQAANGATNIGGFFGLGGTSAASFTASAAVIADNGSAASPMFLARDLGVTVFSVEDGGHLKCSQTTAPTATLTSTTLNAGGGSGAAIAVTSGSTDTAGSFTVTAGNGTPTAGIAGQIVFNKAYTAAPKTVILTNKDADGVNNQVYVSATATTSFTVSFNTALAGSEAVEFYYFVIE